MAFKTLGIIGTHHNPFVAETVQTLQQFLIREGLTVILEKATALAIQQDAAYTLEQLCQHCDLVISVGGDGNLLHAARTLSKYQVPVIGINRGTLGFLTDILPDEIEDTLRPILAGKYSQTRHFLIEGEIIRNDKTHFRSNALNDIVLFQGESAQLIDFKLWINQLFVYQQRSDGLIIATPTGSTAYALSSGGPILQPELDAMVLVPKAPHSLSARPIVIDGNAELKLEICHYRDSLPRLSFDGHVNTVLDYGDQVFIRKQALPLTILHPLTHDYFQALRCKLHWSHSPSYAGRSC